MIVSKPIKHEDDIYHRWFDKKKTTKNSVKKIFSQFCHKKVHYA